MSILQTLLILTFLTLTFEQASRLRPVIIQPNKCRYYNRTHWVFALDRSGSMAGGTPLTKWQKLKNLVNTGLIPALPFSDLISAFAFDHDAIDPNLK